MTASRQRKLGFASLAAGLSLILAVALLEATLRAFPGLIPPALLLRFEPRLRGRIAQGRFPTKGDTVPFIRDDGGFPFTTWKPGARIAQPDLARRLASMGLPPSEAEIMVDENGFCNVPGEYESTARFDIVAIGDSFTWCKDVGPERSWTRQLARLSGLTTYNLGRGGIGLYEYLQILEKFGLPKAPRIVIMNAYEGNDLRDALRDVDYRKHPDPEDSEDPSFMGDPARVGWPLRHTYTENLLRAMIVQRRIPRSTLPERVNFRYHLHFAGGDIAFNTENTDREEVVLARRVGEGEVGFEAFQDALEHFVRLSREHDFIPVLSYTPSAHTAYARQTVFDDPGLTDTLSRFSDAQRGYFRSRAAEMKYLFIDLTPGLQAAAPLHDAPESLLYDPITLHYTESGDRIVAESLWKALHDALPPAASRTVEASLGLSAAN